VGQGTRTAEGGQEKVSFESQLVDTDGFKLLKEIQKTIPDRIQFNLDYDNLSSYRRFTLYMELINNCCQSLH